MLIPILRTSAIGERRKNTWTPLVMHGTLPCYERVVHAAIGHWIMVSRRTIICHYRLQYVAIRRVLLTPSAMHCEASGFTFWNLLVLQYRPSGSRTTGQHAGGIYLSYTGSDRNGNETVAGAASEAFVGWLHHRYSSFELTSAGQIVVNIGKFSIKCHGPHIRNNVPSYIKSAKLVGHHKTYW